MGKPSLQSNSSPERERPFQGVIEASTDAIIVADEDEKILIWNPAAKKLFGYSIEEVLGRDFMHLIVPPKYRDLRSKAYTKAIHNKCLSHRGQIVEAEGMRKDGTTFPLEHTVSMWTVNNKLRFLAILRDVTESRETKQALKALNEELEERVKIRTRELYKTNEELKNFAYIVSHDLKAPLRSVHQLAQWLQGDYQDKFDQEGNELLQLLISRTKRMHILIEDVLAYSRIGRVREEVAEVDLSALLPELVEMIGLPDHMTIDIHDSLPCIDGEIAHIKGIFLNLLTNAIKFNDKPIGTIDIHCKGDHPWWSFTIADNGPGIDPKHHDRIFEIFQTLNSPEDTEGTGFGLSYVKKIVETMGGKIWVDSQISQGAQFHFTWPKGGVVNEY